MLQNHCQTMGFKKKNMAYKIPLGGGGGGGGGGGVNHILPAALSP